MNFDAVDKIISPQFANQIPGLFTVVDLDSNFIFANTTSLDWFGYSSLDQLQGSSYCHFPCRVSEQHEAFTCQDKLVFNREKPLKILGRFCYSKNQWRILFGEKYLIRNRENEVIGVVSYFNDVTNNKIFDFSRLLGSINSETSRLIFSQQMSYYIEDNYPDSLLTEREDECLFYILRGKTTKEVAKLLNISPRTVETHFNNIKQKLICSNRSQVIEKSINLGYMNIIPKKFIA